MYKSAQKVNQVENVHLSEDSQQHFLKKQTNQKPQYIVQSI